MCRIMCDISGLDKVALVATFGIALAVVVGGDLGICRAEDA